MKVIICSPDETRTLLICDKIKEFFDEDKIDFLCSISRSQKKIKGAKMSIDDYESIARQIASANLVVTAGNTKEYESKYPECFIKRELGRKYDIPIMTEAQLDVNLKIKRITQGVKDGR